MKRILVLVAIIACAISVAHAEDDPVRDMVKTTGTFIGKVVYVATGGTGGEKTDLVVEDEKGQKMVFPLDQTVEMVGSAANLATLGELKKNQKVAVKYESSKEGAPKAKSVEVVE